MPLYEYRKNATNQVEVPPSVRQEIVCGTGPVLKQVLSLIQGKKTPGRPIAIAIEGWYGVDWGSLQTGLISAARTFGISLEVNSTAGLFRPTAEIDAYRGPFVTEDPSFGFVNSKGELEDLLDPHAVSALKTQLESRKDFPAEVLVILGPGSTAAGLAGLYDLRFYADYTMQPLLWQMWDGKLVTFGSETPVLDYSWKKYYYCDFYLLLRQKKKAFAQMDYYLEAVDPNNLKLLSASAYNVIIDELVKAPIKQVKITQPGPWGSYRFKEIYDEIPGLENMAWNELAGIELSILVDVGAGAELNFPCQNIMQRPVQ
ncbi:MAG TPA: hypothetical protein VNX46_17060, partial [Candidatus Acidoferrum sp.]|nr:hypothetical protein [Candidatus Acidoferrum sp.]